MEVGATACRRGATPATAPKERAVRSVVEPIRVDGMLDAAPPAVHADVIQNRTGPAEGRRRWGSGCRWPWALAGAGCGHGARHERLACALPRCHSEVVSMESRIGAGPWRGAGRPRRLPPLPALPAPGRLSFRNGAGTGQDPWPPGSALVGIGGGRRSPNPARPHPASRSGRPRAVSVPTTMSIHTRPSGLPPVEPP